MSLEQFRERFLQLKELSGSHSPSIKSLLSLLDKGLEVDACFLSNPYATELFMKNLEEQVLSKEKLHDILEYYPSQNRDIALRLSEALSVSAENVFIGNGAIEIIQAVLHQIVGAKLLVLIPTFSSYYEFVRPDTEVVYFNYFEESCGEWRAEDIITKVKEENITDVVLINPNNPDGYYINYQDINKILENLPNLNSLILDESFVHFAYEDSEMEPLKYDRLISKYSSLVLIKSMSKDFGIAGIRAGYAIMSESRVSNLLATGYLWNSGGLADYFFTLYSKKEFRAEYEVVRKKYIMNTLMFFNSLNQLKNCRMVPSKANFALLEIFNKSSFETFTELLFNHGIYVRDCSDKIGLNGNYIRVASRTFEENLKTLEALKAVIG